MPWPSPASRADEFDDRQEVSAVTGTPVNLDRVLHAWQARVTGGVAPISLTLALLDWAVHLAGSPGAQQRLADKAVRKAGRLAAHVTERWRDPAVPACIDRKSVV